MNTHNELQLRKQIKRWIIFFIVSLALSGITAFPLEWELSVLSGMAQQAPDILRSWIDRVHLSLVDVYSKYPFIAYGTDWLAFAHLVIAVAFIGPFKDPVRNIWVIQFGMIACVMIFPLAFICGPIRGIPFYWQLIDCSFGVIGLIPLYLCHQKIKKLELITNK